MIGVRYVVSWAAMKMEGKNQSKSSPYQPPAKKRIKWIEAITKCRYSAKKIINSIEPLYSTWYPATTSDSVSA